MFSTAVYDITEFEKVVLSQALLTSARGVSGEIGNQFCSLHRWSKGFTVGATKWWVGRRVGNTGGVSDLFFSGSFL